MDYGGRSTPTFRRFQLSGLLLASCAAAAVTGSAVGGDAGFGWPKDFDPFSGRSTAGHPWPWASLISISGSARPDP